MLIATELGERLALFLGLHTLCDHVQFQCMGERDDGAGDGPRPFVDRDMLDQYVVQLQLVDLEVLQADQAGVAGAEIVHRDADASLLECQ